MYRRRLVITLAIVTATVAEACDPLQRGAQYLSGTVYSDGGKLKFCSGKIDQQNGVAWGTYNAKDMYSTGWAKLSINSNPRISDKDQVRAAGYLEGVLTGPFILAYEDNMLSAQERFPRGMPDKIKTFYQKHLEWLSEYTKAKEAGVSKSPQQVVTTKSTQSLERQAESNDDVEETETNESSSQLLQTQEEEEEGDEMERSYWTHVSLVHQQMEALKDGANDILPEGQRIDTWRILMLNAHIELLQLRDSSGVNWHGEGPAGNFKYSGSAPTGSQPNMKAPNKPPFLRPPSQTQQGRRPLRLAHLEKDGGEYGGVSPLETEQEQEERLNLQQYKWLASWQPAWMARKYDPLVHIVDPDAHACTAAVALIEDLEKGADITIGHTTWGPYALMTRVYKYYNIPLNEKNTVATEWSVPSWPGVIAQSYDLYGMYKGRIPATDSDLERRGEEVKIATTGAHFWVTDKSILNKLNPKDHVMSTMRYLVAHRLARSAKQWVELAAKNNGWGAMSGTMYVVDYGKLEQNRKQLPKEGLLMMLENTPGIAAIEDHTSLLLQNKALGLFNQAISKEVTKARAGQGLATSERYQAFERSKEQLVTQGSSKMEEIMTNPPFAPRDGGSYGAIDAKVASLENAANLESIAMSGPPAKDAPYKLSTISNNFKAALMPLEFDYGWYKFRPQPSNDSMNGLALEASPAGVDELGLWVRAMA